MISFPRSLVASDSSPNGNIFYTGYFDLACILDPNIMTTDDQDSYIVRVIDEQVTGTFAKPNLVNGAGSKSDEKSLIRIYPNPCSYLLTIQSDFLSSDYQSEIFIRDLTGRIIFTFLNNENASGQYTINTSGLSHGVFLLELKNYNGIHFAKFLKIN